ncbi:MAG: histidinol-phosphate transaminase [Candidatus Omnitrophica bacterium]|nr:histidinol-phosphate transaminase [Candidatus Omnitrophota bacterium]
MENLVRKNILTVNPYVAGKPIEETRRELGLKKIIKLASNENPLGVSPLAIKAIKKSLASLNRYPDSQGFYLKKRLARNFGLKSSNIVLGNGSDELIDIIIRTFVEDDENIVTSEGAFLEYEIIASVFGRKMIKAPMKYFKYDLVAIKKKIDPKTKLVFIANPNNPTGTYVCRAEFEDFLKSLPDSVIVVMDEAYDTFVDVDDFPLTLNYVNQKNLIILKTFSKAYGLAGLRIGFAIAGQELASYMERSRQPFNVNLLAQAGALAALDDKKFLARTRKTVLEGKNYLYDELKKLGISYLPSVANFILMDAGRDGTAVFRLLLKFGVIVRDMKQYGMKNFIRVSVGTKKENERFIRVLRKVVR